MEDKCIQCESPFSEDHLRFNSHYCMKCIAQRYRKGDIVLIKSNDLFFPVIIQSIESAFPYAMVVTSINSHLTEIYPLSFIMGRIIPTPEWEGM